MPGQSRCGRRQCALLLVPASIGLGRRPRQGRQVAEHDLGGNRPYAPVHDLDFQSGAPSGCCFTVDVAAAVRLLASMAYKAAPASGHDAAGLTLLRIAGARDLANLIAKVREPRRQAPASPMQGRDVGLVGVAHAAADRHCGSRWVRTLPRLRLRVPGWATSGATCGLSVTGAGRANPPQALAAVHLTCRTRVTPPLASGALADDSSRSSATARCGATLRFPPCGCLGAVRSARPSIRMPAGNVALSLL